jgi:hypothetical protein
MPAPAPAATAPSVTEFAETSALISQIANEARSSGQSLVYDPETGADAADGDEPPAKPAKPAKGKEAKPGRGRDGKFTREAKQAEEAEGDELAGEESDEAEQIDEAADADQADEAEQTEDEGDDDDAAPAGEFDRDAIQAALDSDGGVDMLALAKALGKDPEELGVTPAQHLALRVAQRKAKATLKRAGDLADKLQKQFGDPVRARKAVETGDLNPAIEYVEGVFGMSWNELNRAVSAALVGKPLPDLEAKRELRELKKKEQERAEQDKKTKEETAAAQRAEEAKQFIAAKIKGDKLASPEFNKLLKDAGFPTITDLVFEELRQGFSKGLTDPKKALEKVRARLQKQAKALAAGGLVATAQPPKKAAVSASKPRAQAQAGAAGNARQMTDAELRSAVLREAGLLRK